MVATNCDSLESTADARSPQFVRDSDSKPMKTSELLHFAFRARDPLALGRWYAELFEGQFFVHPVMSALGIVIVKINHPEAVFDGLLEFWPWDLEWDGAAGVFRKIEARPSPTSYGHAAVKVAADAADDLQRAGAARRCLSHGAAGDWVS